VITLVDIYSSVSVSRFFIFTSSEFRQYIFHIHQFRISSVDFWKLIVLVDLAFQHGVKYGWVRHCWQGLRAGGGSCYIRWQQWTKECQWSNPTWTPCL